MHPRITRAALVLAAALSSPSPSTTARAALPEVPAPSSATPTTLASTPTTPPATQRASLFDPARHMRVSEVRTGMKGYGLSVFHGTKIEKFDVTVVSVVKNFNAGLDGVLIMCSGQGLEHSGAVAGMSGSPVYLYDDSGKARLIGAFAFGWSLAKDPIAGVQPIEYMLQYADPKRTLAGSRIDDTLLTNSPASASITKARWNYWDVAPRSTRTSTPAPPAAAPAAYPFISRDSFQPNPAWTYAASPSASGANTLSLSFGISGLNSPTLSNWQPVLSAYGLTRTSLGISSAGGVEPGVVEEESTAPASIEPGSSLVVPMLSGDIDMTAVGTCTEVIGDRVFGFGHPFNGEGGIEMPMGAGYVHTIVSTLNSSFKMGALTKNLGVLRTDTSVGIGGTFGGAARTIPMTVHVVYDDGTLDRTYRFESVRHPRFTPLLFIASLTGALNGIREAPSQNTLRYDTTFHLPAGPDGKDRQLQLSNVLVNANPAQIFFQTGMPLMTLAENPFQRLYPDSIETTIRVSGGARSAEIISAEPRRTHYKPGQTVSIDLAYRPLHAAEETQRLELALPPNLDPGDYTLVVSDAERFQSDEAGARPDKFAANDIDQVIKVFREQAANRNDAIYLRLIREPDGVAVGNVPLLKLPGSRQQLLMDSSRAGIAPAAPSTTRIIPSPTVITGSTEVTITVDPTNTPETATAKAGASKSPHPPRQATPPAPKPKAAPPEDPSAIPAGD